MNTAQHRRVIGRREIQSPRAGASVVTAVILILALGWVGTEVVLAILGQRPLLVSPLQMAQWAASVPELTMAGVLVASGLVLAVLGVVLILAGLLPGARARHLLARDRATVIVDDGVIADALSRVARQRARLVPGQVTAVISRRQAELGIRPTSGIPVDGDDVRETVQAELERYALDPEPRLSVRVSNQGAIGV